MQAHVCSMDWPSSGDFLDSNKDVCINEVRHKKRKREMDWYRYREAGVELLLEIYISG